MNAGFLIASCAIDVEDTSALMDTVCRLAEEFDRAPDGYQRAGYMSAIDVFARERLTEIYKKEDYPPKIMVASRLQNGQATAQGAVVVSGDCETAFRAGITGGMHKVDEWPDGESFYERYESEDGSDELTIGSLCPVNEELRDLANNGMVVHSSLHGRTTGNPRPKASDIKKYICRRIKRR